MHSDKHLKSEISKEMTRNTTSTKQVLEFINVFSLVAALLFEPVSRAQLREALHTVHCSHDALQPLMKKLMAHFLTYQFTCGLFVRVNDVCWASATRGHQNPENNDASTEYKSGHSR